jgi:hypothetical protein
LPRPTPDEQGWVRFVDPSTPGEDWCEPQGRACFLEDLDPNFVYTAPAGLRIQSVVIFVYTGAAEGVYLGWLNPPDYPTCDNRFATYCLTAKRDIAGAFSIGLSRRMATDSQRSPVAVVDVQLAAAGTIADAADVPSERFDRENAGPGIPAIR